MATTPVEVKTTTAAPAPTPAPTVPDVMRSFRTEMDRLFDRFTDGWFGMPSLRRMLDVVPTPAIDMTEDADGYKLTAELPGMAENDIEVALTDGILTLKGEKKQEQEKKDKNYYLSERSYGAFQRSFTLPDGVDRDKVSAEFSKGVLTVTMPKTAQAKAEPKKIEVKAAA